MDEWPDSRLDEFSRRIDGRLGEMSRRIDVTDAKINGMPGDVRTLTSEVASLKREVTSPDGAVGKLTSKIDEMIGNPIAERRQRSQALWLNAFLIIGTGICTYLAYALLRLH